LANNKSWVRVRAEYAVARALVFAMEMLPLPLAERVAHGTARILDLLVPKLRRVANTNLAFAFPTMDQAGRTRIVDGVFASVGRLLLALSRFPRINKANVHELIVYEGLENYEAAKQIGRGVLVATAHLGNWELSAFTHAYMTEPMHVMVRPLDNPLIDDLVERRRVASGNKLIFKKDAARNVLKALKNNDAVGILMDQNASLNEGVFVDFFGKPACANSAFVKLAQHSGATVIPGFAFWDEARRKYVLRFYPQVSMSGDVLVDTQRVHNELERIIREYPDQWMWIHRRWKTRPVGEGGVY
jgi:KDO2-lipid IV(A) lauroyltransferase